MKFSTFLDEVFDQLRTARVSQKYYGKKLKTLQRTQVAMDVLVAIGVSGTLGVILFSHVNGGVAKVTWPGLALIATVMAVLRPVLRLDEKLKQAAAQHEGSRNLFLGLERLFAQARIKGSLTADMEQQLWDAREQKGVLSAGDPALHLPTLKKVQAEVELEFGDRASWPGATG